jgi:hypothetical protein
MVDQIASRGDCILTFSRNLTLIALVFSPFLGSQELNPGTKAGQTFNSSGCLMPSTVRVPRVAVRIFPYKCPMLQDIVHP